MEGTHGETEIQNFWITNGFFLNPSSIDSFTLPILKCYSDKGRPLPDRQLQPLQAIYFRHTKALEYKYREETSNFSYTYLNEQTKEAVFMQNSLKLYYYENFRLELLDFDTGKEIQIIEYFPGVAIQGCILYTKR